MFITSSFDSLVGFFIPDIIWLRRFWYWAASWYPVCRVLSRSAASIFSDEYAAA